MVNGRLKYGGPLIAGLIRRSCGKCEAGDPHRPTENLRKNVTEYLRVFFFFACPSTSSAHRTQPLTTVSNVHQHEFLLIARARMCPVSYVRVLYPVLLLCSSFIYCASSLPKRSRAVDDCVFATASESGGDRKDERTGH